MAVIIGIVSNKKVVKGSLNSTVYFDYIHSIYKAGGIPIIIPLINDSEFITHVLNHLDGLLFPGGVDIHPKWFNQEVKPLCGTINEELDAFEINIMKCAFELDIPILAICRGIQVMNVACNGTLYQDIAYYPNRDKSIVHAQDQFGIAHHRPVHEITIKEESFLGELYGTKLKTNSFHHQIINQLGEGLVCTATSEDGVIEGIEMKNKRYVQGVQWHPEKMVDTSQDQLNLFKQFIDVCEQLKVKY